MEKNIDNPISEKRGKIRLFFLEKRGKIRVYNVAKRGKMIYYS